MTNNAGFEILRCALNKIPHKRILTEDDLLLEIFQFRASLVVPRCAFDKMCTIVFSVEIYHFCFHKRAGFIVFTLQLKQLFFLDLW